MCATRLRPRLRPRVRPRARLFVGLLLAILGVAGLGCRQGLYDQAKYEPYEANPLFANGMAARPLPAHTVARGHLREDLGYFTGATAPNEYLASFPMEITREVLERGEQRFNIFCSPCHGKTGVGNGMIVQRGYKKPASYLEDWVVNSDPGFYVNVMVQGYGVMPSYASQVPPEDRWAIAAWIRVLQSAREVPFGDLTEEQQARLLEIAVQTAAVDEPSSPAAPSPEVPQ